MHIGRVRHAGRDVPVVNDAGTLWDISPLAETVTPELLKSGGNRIREFLEAGVLTPVEASAPALAPIVSAGAVICVGMNYAAHAAESGSEPPRNVVIFHKHPNTIAAPNGLVTIPPDSERTDWEVELAVIIGEKSYRLADRAAAQAAIAGYTLANDYSERDWQLEVSGGQWGKGKSAPGFLPLGPWIVTADAFDPSDTGLRSWVNGEPRQDARTSDMIFDVADIVLELSQYMTLDPGDVILTGTPEGVALSGRFPYLRRGDVVEVEIDGIGRQCQVMA